VLVSCVPNLDVFSQCYVYSATFGTSGTISGLNEDYQAALGSILTEPTTTNQMLDAPIYTATGDSDSLFTEPTLTTDMFTAAGVKAVFQESDGGHEMANWRRHLWQTLQIMFTNTSGCDN
jgi:enterochelin esterase-like enzyme